MKRSFISERIFCSKQNKQKNWKNINSFMKLGITLFRTRMAPKTTKAGKTEASALKKEPNQALNVDKNGDIAIKVLAKPGSKESGITGLTEEGLEVKIAAPPVDGEANVTLIQFLSKLLNIRKSDLSLSGSRSRTKTVTISKETGLSIEKTNEILKSNIGK